MSHHRLGQESSPRLLSRGDCLLPQSRPPTMVLQFRRNAGETLLASVLAPCFPAISRCQHWSSVPVWVSGALRSLLGEQRRTEGLFFQQVSQLAMGAQGAEAGSGPWLINGEGLALAALGARDSGGTGEGLPPSRPCHPSDKLRETLSLCLAGRAEMPALITLVSRVVLLGAARLCPAQGCSERLCARASSLGTPALPPCPALGGPTQRVQPTLLSSFCTSASL